MDNNISLDDLFKEARRTLHQSKAQALGKTKPIAETPDPGDLSGWKRTRGIALIHQETHTVIGNFVEYTHPHIPGARRLIRELEVLPVQAVEYVTGTWNDPTPVEPIRTPRLLNEMRSNSLDITLKELGMSATAVSVFAHFGDGTLDKVVITREVQFTSKLPCEYIPSFYFLPAGTNILPEMSIHSIRQLLTNLGQPLP